LLRRRIESVEADVGKVLFVHPEIVPELVIESPGDLVGEPFALPLRPFERFRPRAEDLLRRVFENLIRNAWEATGDEGRLRVDLHELSRNRVAIRFEDDGPGIPASEVSRLFKPFYTAKPGGTGLGLSLVHRIVDAHRGEISVEGRPGIGAAFTVILPAAVEPKPETP